MADDPIEERTGAATTLKNHSPHHEPTDKFCVRVNATVSPTRLKHQGYARTPGERCYSWGKGLGRKGQKVRECIVRSGWPTSHQKAVIAYGGASPSYSPTCLNINSCDDVKNQRKSIYQKDIQLERYMEVENV